MEPGLTLTLLTVGLVAGALGSILGLGGGIVIVPVLALALGVPMHFAIATSLLCVVATSSGAASRYVRSGIANVRLGVALEIWTVVGSIAGGALAGLLSGSALMRIFAVAMGAMSAAMFRGPAEVAAAAQAEEPEAPQSFRERLNGSYTDSAVSAIVGYRIRRLPLAMGVSSLSGVLSGLLGVGGGVVTVPTLALFCGLPMKAAAATSSFIIGVTGVAGAIIYWGRGEVSPALSAATVLGAFVGARLGPSLAGRLHATAIRKLFAVVMIVVAVQMFLKAQGWPR